MKKLLKSVLSLTMILVLVAPGSLTVNACDDPVVSGGNDDECAGIHDLYENYDVPEFIIEIIWAYPAPEVYFITKNGVVKSIYDYSVPEDWVTLGRYHVEILMESMEYTEFVNYLQVGIEPFEIGIDPFQFCCGVPRSGEVRISSERSSHTYWAGGIMLATCFITTNTYRRFNGWDCRRSYRTTVIHSNAGLCGRA
jgi:hypothetical protein